jgi:glucan 1,3-beta-glucosidase
VNSTWHDPDTLPSSAIGLYVRTSNNILIYGAGLYSFYQQVCSAIAVEGADVHARTLQYSQHPCEDGISCQATIVDIDSASTPLHIYQLATIGVQKMLQIDNTSFASAQDNNDDLAVRRTTTDACDPS